MSDRFVWTLLVPAVLGASASAQSNVRPLPKAAMVSEMGMSLSRETLPRSLPALPRGPAASRYEDLAPIADRQGDVPQVEMQIEALYYPAADFDGSPGSVAIQRGGWDAELGYKVADDRSFTLHLHTEASFYDFGNGSAIVPGSQKPFNDLYETMLGTSLCVANTARTSWFAGFELGLSGEDEASIGEAVTLGGVSGLRYQAHENLALQVGVAAQTRLEDQPWVIPFLGFEWDINDRWTLTAEGWQARLQGDLDDRWSIFGEAVYEVRQFRLNDDNPLPGGVARDEEITIGAGVQWQPAEGIKVSFEGGLVAWQELTMLDEDGNRISETETSNGKYAAIGVELAF